MKFKKSISFVLTLCMVLSLFATFVVPASAEATNVALNKTYTISGCGERSTYYAKLTDGVAKTALSYNNDEWFGFYCNGTDASVINAPDKLGYVVIDLGASYDIHSVSVNFVDNAGGSGISAPTAVNAYLSADGETWSDAVALTIPAETTKGVAYAVEGEVSGNARYVKVDVALATTFAFLNEIEVYGTEAVAEAPVTSNVVTDWNVADWNGTELGASAAIIFTDAEAYLATTGYTWWSHASFKPTDEAGVYEVVARRGATGEAVSYEIVEGGFVWLAHDTAAEGTPGAYAHAIIRTLNAGDKVVFTGLDIANQTTAADATAEKVVVTEDPIETPEFAGENVALNKKYTYPTAGLYFHWSDEWPCTDNVATAITDGVREAGYYGEGTTSGWGGASPNPVEIVIDLEAVYNISGFVYVLCGGADGISHPEVVEISVSADNETFVPVSVETVTGNKYSSQDWSPCYDLDYYATPASAVEGRYVKFAFTKTGNFVFINELEVYGAEAPAEEDDESYKDTYTYVDGVTNGTSQSRADGWESIPVVDFWYLVEDGESTVTVNVAVDNKKISVDDTMLRIWIDTDPSDTARTTLVDTKVKDGAAYVARVDAGFDAAILSQTYSVIGNDYYLTVVLDKATLGITGQYGLNIQLGQAGYNTLHSITWDAFDSSLVPWSTTAFYEIFGEEPEVPVAPEYNEGWNAEFDENELKLFKDVALFGDGKWGEDATAFGHADVILVQNLVCKNPDLYPELTLVYNAGTAIDVNNIKVGLYAETNSMIGFPSKDAKVYVSNDGIEWTLVESTNNIPESVFVQHGNSENSLGTSIIDISFADTTAQYVKVVFTYTDSPFNDPNGDYKPVYEFIGFTEAEVSYVEPSAELPEDATGLDIYGYTHIYLNYVMYVDADMTLGELVAKYFGQSKDLNYFKVIVVNEDGTVAATYLTLGRPDGVKTDFTVTAGQYVLALSADGSNAGRHEIADTVNVGDIVTLYNVDFTAEPGELANAGFTVEAAPVEEDDESYKDTYTYVDGETVGTTQSRGDGWEALLVPDFWYVVEDGEATVTIKIAVDDRTVVEEDTMFRTWIDADLSDTARTTLVDVKVKDGVAYVARCDNELGAAVLSATYEVIGNDYFFVVELDKATLGIDGQYGLMLTLSETGYNSMHNVAWDVYDVSGCAPWNSTKDYIVYGEVSAPSLDEVDGGELPAHNPRFGPLNIAANTAITYTVAFEHGANFSLWSEDVSVLVNGEALEFGELGYVAVLAKGDTVTIVNEGAEAVDIYPSIVAVIPGSMSNPIVLDELGDIVANVTEDLVDSGAVFYTFTAPANGTLTITMPEGNWTYTVHNLTAGIYGDTQWSDSDPVLSTYSIEVSAGDEIEIIVGTYNPDEPYTAPVGELTFNAAFEEAKVVSNVVTDWNTSKWGGADEAHIFTNQEAYLACTHTWWSHVSFKPTSFEGVYEVVAIRGATGEAAAYEIAEGGFIWLAHDTAAEGTAGAYAHALIKTLAVGDLVKFTGIDVANCTTTEDATAEKWEAPKADDVVKLEVSHQNLYNWGTYQSMIICDPGKTVTDVISQTPYWWIMYVVEEVDGVYVATAYYKNCDEINTTVCPENGFLYYVYSANSAWAVADEGKLLGYVFNVGDIVLGDKFAIDTSKDTPYTVVALNPEAIKAGDVNLNGEIDAADYAIVRKLVLGTLTAEDIGDLAYDAADVNGDGKVNARDYYLIKRAYLGTYVIPGWEVEDDAE